MTARPARGVGALAVTVALAVAVALAGAGCGAGSGGGSGSTLTVFAAASLTDAFTALDRGYQRAHPGVHVVTSFAGSQSLVAQLRQGAPADVLATADERTMHQAAADLAGKPVSFARNGLEIAVAKGDPRHIDSLADLGRAGLTVVLAAPQVPAGGYAAKALAAAGVQVHPASLEPSVRSVLTKVELGEADAGIVYRTDVAAAGDRVTGVPIAAADQQQVVYPIAAVRDSAAARDYVAYVTSPAGQQVLRRFGFAPP